MAEIRGTMFERKNGTFTVLTEPTWDSKKGRYRRRSLGTFGTRDEAIRARLDYNVQSANGVFSLTDVEQRKVRLHQYLAEWIELIDRERPVVQLTAAGYTGAVVFLRSFSYGVSPASPPWGRLKLSKSSHCWRRSLNRSVLSMTTPSSIR